MKSQSIISERFGTNFLLDLFTIRIPYIAKLDLMRIGCHFGASQQSMKSQLSRGWKAGLIRRTMVNAATEKSGSPIYFGPSVELIRKAAKALTDREALLRNSSRIPTEVISIGPLTAGLMGKSLSRPDKVVMEASLRLSQAFVYHVEDGNDIRSWRLLDQSSILTRQAMAAVVKYGKNERKKLVIVPIVNRSKHIRLFEDLQKQGGEYEVW